MARVQAADQAHPGQPIRRDGGAGPANRWLVLAIVLSAVFMQLLDVTVTTVAVPSIQRSLHTTFGEVQLVLAGYSLAFACVLITGGRLGDIYGRKRLFLIGMVTFTAASAACGAAPDALTLVVARIVQGMCSGLMFPQVLAILQVTFPDREKQKAFAAYGASIGLATILGPVLGGALIKLNLFGTDWRSIFYVNVPIGLMALAAGIRYVDESTAPHADRLDLPGMAAVTAGLFLLVLPLVIGRDQGWPTWSLGMLLVIGLAGVAWQMHSAGPGLHGYRLSPPLIVAGTGAGLVLAPLTSVILAGIRTADAGAASGVLATAQQVGAAAGIAIAGILFFGQLATNSSAAASAAVPALGTRLAAAGLPAHDASQVVAGFRSCFHDRTSQNDPTATPPSCQRIQRQIAAAPAPAAVKQAVAAAVTGRAVPLARKDDFTRSLQHTLLLWQIPAFLLTGLLVFALPKVKPSSTTPGGA